MNHFAIAWQRTYSVERGYSNNSADPGGETNHGITKATALRFGYFEDMRKLTVERAAAIALLGYWDPLRLSEVAELAPTVAYELFDTNFNLWWPAAGLFLQRALNALNRGATDYPDLRVDGDIGPSTLSALKKFLGVRGEPGAVVLVRTLNSQQCGDYLRQCVENPAKEAFFFGWVLQRVAI